MRSVYIIDKIIKNLNKFILFLTIRIVVTTRLKMQDIRTLRVNHSYSHI